MHVLQCLFLAYVRAESMNGAQEPTHVIGYECFLE